MTVRNKTVLALLTLALYFVSVSFAMLHTGQSLTVLAKNLKSTRFATTAHIPSQATQQTSLSLATEPSKNNYISNTMPTAVAVPQLSLSLPIELGVYNPHSASWNISDAAAYFAEPTSKLTSSAGQTVLYAHNKNNLFGKIKQLNPGGVVVVTDEKNQQWIYSLQSSKRVSPTNTDVLYEKPNTPRLVLITCDGLFDEARKLLYFDLIQPQPNQISYGGM